jgi:2-dehydro-3-deoxygluconokinase
VARAAALAREAGVPVSLDLNYRARLWGAEEFVSALRPLVDGCRLVLAGTEEARMLLGAGPQVEGEELADELVELGAAEAVVKLGDAGALLAGAGARVRQAARPAAVVDEVGAGDAFAAGMIGALLLGKASDEAVRWGAVAASFAIGAHGDVTGLPTRAELEAALGGATDVVR